MPKTTTAANHWGLSEQVGYVVRAWREARPGVRQEDVLEAAKSLGLDWSRSSVTELEAGRRRLSAEELLLLPAVLRAATGDLASPPDVAELLSTETSRRLRLTKVRRVRLGAIDVDDGTMRAFLAGRTAGDHEIDETWSVKHVEPAPKAGDAERKAARRLGVTPAVVVERSMALWGRTLSAERDHRLVDGLDTNAGPETTRATRGHITRQLVAELSEKESD